MIHYIKKQQQKEDSDVEKPSEPEKFQINREGEDRPDFSVSKYNKIKHEDSSDNEEVSEADNDGMDVYEIPGAYANNLYERYFDSDDEKYSSDEIQEKEGDEISNIVSEFKQLLNKKPKKFNYKYYQKQRDGHFVQKVVKKKPKQK